jgi:hypothetical protein
LSIDDVALVGLSAAERLSAQATCCDGWQMSGLRDFEHHFYRLYIPLLEMFEIYNDL